MAKVKPFRGLLYDPDTVGDLSAVMAPPYDVISGEMKEELHKRSALNIIRLILGKDLPGDDDLNNKYTRSAGYMEEWVEKGFLVTDREDSFYVYLQSYDIGGVTSRRIGFLGLMKFEGPDIVLPHEHTLSKPKQDRMKLIKEVETNLSPIFGLYGDETGIVSGILKRVSEGMAPAIDIEVDGVRHILWKLSDKSDISTMVKAMEGKKIFIADGHHRYAVAKEYRDMCLSSPGYDGRADHVLMYFTDMSDPDNLSILATHRVLNHVPEALKRGIQPRLSRYFDLTCFDSLEKLMTEMSQRKHRSYVYGLYDGSCFRLLEPKNEEVLRDLIKGKPLSWKDLDVSVLHSTILDKILEFKAEEGDITYVKEPEEAVYLVDGAGGKAAFFLNPTKISQLKAVAEGGEMMPQKSTYFYPKLLTGLVMNRFADQKQEVM